MTKTVRVLLTGSTGQLGHALRRFSPAELNGQPVELIATSRSGQDGCLPLDLSDGRACQQCIEEVQPDWVINAGAYTAVDKAETEVDEAVAINAGAPRSFAQALDQVGKGKLLQISTDFVFDGAQGVPYRTDHPCNPLGQYGITKAMGERALQDALDPGRAVILRTSWVYGPVGRNFLLTMLKLHRQRAAAGEALAVVADQIGCPTSTAGLAEACWTLLGRGQAGTVPGTLHWSDAGVASWYDFAVAIGELGVLSGVLERAAEVRPIGTADYPTPAQRPAYSLLDCASTRAALGLQSPHWRSALMDVLRDGGLLSA